MEAIILDIGIVGATFLVFSFRRFRSGHVFQSKRRRLKFATTDPEVVIIGAGITGASLAAALGKKGRRVVVIERDMSPPNTFRGEGLQPGGQNTLIDMGLKEVVDDIRAEGTPLRGILLHDFEPRVKIRATFSQPMIGSRQATFVQCLRKHAVTFIEGIATGLLKEEGRITGVKYRERGSHELKPMRAPLTVIYDGLYSYLRKEITSENHSETESYDVGFEITHNQDIELSYGDVYMGHPLVATIRYVIDDTTSRLFFSFPNKPPANVREFIESNVVPDLPECLRTPVLEGLKRCPRPTCVQSKRMPATSDNMPGVLILGDALNTRSGLAATGMTVCFKDVQFWHRTIDDIPDLSDDEAFLKCKDMLFKERKSYAWTINTTIHALSTLALERESSSVKLRQALMRNTKALESDLVPPEVRQAAFDFFALLHTDQSIIRTVLYDACREAVLKSLTWGSLVQPWKTLTDVYGIIAKYRSLINADV